MSSDRPRNAVKPLLREGSGPSRLAGRPGPMPGQWGRRTAACLVIRRGRPAPSTPPKQMGVGQCYGTLRAGTAPAAGWFPVPPRTKPGQTGCSPIGVVPPGGQWPLRYCAGVSTLSRSSCSCYRRRQRAHRFVGSAHRAGPHWVAARRFSESSMTSGRLLQRTRLGRRPRGPVGKIWIDDWMQKQRGRALQAHDPIT
jgi:hypothetical protein